MLILTRKQKLILSVVVRRTWNFLVNAQSALKLHLDVIVSSKCIHHIFTMYKAM